MNNCEQVRKHTIQSFKSATYHVLDFDMACLSTCECDCTPLFSRPDVYSGSSQMSETELFCKTGYRHLITEYFYAKVPSWMFD